MTILKQGFEAVASGLREFGYPTVTADQIAVAHADWIAGKDHPRDVIYMFAIRDFAEHPNIFGERSK